MCTAIRFNERFFGRTLDFERSFGEKMLIVPRGRMKIGEAENRYAMMGVGVLCDGTPLYFDGMNEWGLSAAALNFPDFAVYDGMGEGTGISSAHLISLVLGFCRSVDEAKEMLSKIRITDKGADEKTPPTPLHWIFADQRGSAVVESVSEGLKIYDNPVGVLTNSPELPYHLTRLADFSALQTRNPKNTLAESRLYSRGMGAIGLPGDFSSSSRFVKAVFVKENTHLPDDNSAIGRAFSALSSVAVPHGCVITDEGEPAYTLYTALADMENTTYYLTTASCRTVRSLKLTDGFCEGGEIVSIPIYEDEIIIDLLRR